MQNSELYRRGVVVPLGRDAADRLACNDIEETTPVRAIGIASQQDFEDLWDSGLFAGINQRLGLCLDDYEEQVVEPRLVPALKEILILLARKERENSARSVFLDGVMELCDIAIRDDVPLYFIL